MKKTVRVHIADDEPLALIYLTEMITRHPLLCVEKAGSSHKAEKIIEEWSPHICLMDLGLTDINNDELYLPKRHSKSISLIVNSATNDIERAFMAANSGIARMIAKPPDFFVVDFWRLLRDVFLGWCILPVPGNATNPVFRKCCRVVKEEQPRNVSDWANRVGITDTYLRKLWSEHYFLTPKHVLFLYKLYKDVYDYYNEMYLAELNKRAMNKIAYCDGTEWGQRIGYYLLHKNEFAAIRDKSKQTHFPAVVA